MKKYAFTLIELLAVVAIISILSLIGIVNMLESSVRTKVTATKAQMRTITGALEAYHIDNGAYIYFV